MMNERGKSDPAVVAAKLANKAERSAAEPVEPRAGTKGECKPATLGPDAEPGNRATGAAAHTSNRKNSDLPSLTRGRSRMRESHTYGSVRGAGSNLRPYRDRLWRCTKSAAIWGAPDVLPTSLRRQPLTQTRHPRRHRVGISQSNVLIWP